MARKEAVFLGCLGARSLLVWAAFWSSHGGGPGREAIRESLILYTLAAAVGWVAMWANTWRTKGMWGGGWWAGVRPAHALLYAGFAAATAVRRADAWYFLGADVLLAVASWAVLS
jgi:hypothetical protein